MDEHGFVGTREGLGDTSMDGSTLGVCRAYRPSPQDVGTRMITLTVLDPEGHTGVRTYVVNVIRPSGSKQARAAGNAGGVSPAYLNLFMQAK